MRLSRRDLHTTQHQHVSDFLAVVVVVGYIEAVVLVLTNSTRVFVCVCVYVRCYFITVVADGAHFLSIFFSPLFFPHAQTYNLQCILPISLSFF